jgi:hypothetical protein
MNQLQKVRFPRRLAQSRTDRRTQPGFGGRQSVVGRWRFETNSTNVDTWRALATRCGGGRKEGTVTGKIFEKDGKKRITPSKVEYAKK